MNLAMPLPIRVSSRVPASLLMFGVIALGIPGCAENGASSPAVSAARTKYLLGAEPAAATTFVEARQQADGASEVVVTGRIGVPDQEPWTAGKAAFVIRDAAEEGAESHGGETHDPANCPFCKRKASQPEAQAIVQFVDEQGNVLPIDARELFGLAVNQKVTVRGKAKMVDAETLVVSADGLFVGQP